MSSMTVFSHEAVSGSDQRHPRFVVESISQLVDSDRSFGFHHGEVDLGKVERPGCGHGGQVEVGEDRLAVRPLMTGNLHLGVQGVDHPRVVGLPRVGSPSQHHHPGPVHPAPAMQRVQHPRHACGVAGDHSGERSIDRILIVDLGHEGVAGELM